MSREDDETEALLEGEELELSGLEGRDDETEIVRLTWRQKIVTGVAVLVSFLLLSIVLLPYEQVLRFTLDKYARVVRIDFSSIKFSPFGTDEISGLKIALPDGTSLSADAVQSELKIREVLAGNPNGVVSMVGVDINTQNFGMKTRTVEVNISLANAGGAMEEMNGDVTVKTGKLDLKKIPENIIPIPIQTGDVRIASFLLKARFRNGNLVLDETNMKSNVFDLRVTGGGKLQGPLGGTRMDAKVCVKPAKDLETENAGLFAMYIAGGGAAGGELCFAMKGTLGSPAFEPEKKAKE